MATGSVGCVGVGELLLLLELLLSWLPSVSSGVVLLSPAVALCGHSSYKNNIKHLLNFVSCSLTIDKHPAFMSHSFDK